MFYCQSIRILTGHKCIENGVDYADIPFISILSCTKHNHNIHMYVRTGVLFIRTSVYTQMFD